MNKKPTKSWKEEANEENEGGVTNGFLDLVNGYLNMQEEIADLEVTKQQYIKDILASGVKPGTVFSFPEVPNEKYTIAPTGFDIKRVRKGKK